jgi:pimeloyl-ACP methyl ester carboxylesterase
MAMLRAMCLRAGQQVFEAQIEALLHRPDVDPVLAALQCPTMIVVGSDDQWSPLAQHQVIARRLHHARLDVIAGAGHMAPAEDPVQFNHLVREWLTLKRDRTVTA